MHSTTGLPVWLRLGVKGTVLLDLAIQPGAKKSGMAGIHGDRLKLKVASPPVDGKANDAVTTFLADFFVIGLRHVTVVRGKSSRLKTVSINGLSADVVLAKLSSFWLPNVPTQYT